MKKGWEIKKIGDLCNLMTGGTPSRSKPEYFINGEIKWLVSGDIHKKEIFDCEGRITEEAMKNSNTKFLPINSVIIALNGQGKTRGAVALLRTKVTCNQSLVSIYPKDLKKILPEYIFCNLYGRYEEIRRITGDDEKDRRGLNMPLIRNIEIPLPSIEEQQRIVAFLDQAFAAIAKAKSNVEQNIKNAKELFESYLQGVFENKGEGWVNSTIGETCNLITGGTPSRAKKEYFENGNINWLVSGDINKKVITNCEGRITELGFENASVKYLPINSVMIALNGQGKTRGTVAMLKIKATCNQSLVSIYPKNDKELISELIYANLEGRYNEIRKITGDGGNDRRGLNMPLIRKIQFSYPKDLNEQRSIIKKLDALSSEIKKLEAIYQQKINDLEELKKSVLQKAFSGELKTEKTPIKC